MKTNNTNTAALTIAEAIKQGNSIVNQRIKGEFINKHVYANVNQMVEYILNKGFEDSNAPFNFDDITNFYSYPEFYGTFANFEGGSEEEKQNEIERLRDLQNDLYDQILEDKTNEDEIEEKRSKIEEEIEELENLESEPAEIYEWWIVSSYLAEKLNKKGYCIIESENIWGRQTTGQAILLDYIITVICAEMEILEGQTNSWA